MAANYPLSDLASLKEQFVGRKLNELPTPSIVLDRSLVKKNCAAMLQICTKLGLGFRAHVKSHKTLELSRLMVGDGLQDTGEQKALFIVSTVAEAENLAPYVQQCQEKGREASILYGVPVPQGAVSRLVALANRLAPGSINVIIDNADAFARFHDNLTAHADFSNSKKIGVFVKIDTGYHRAGITTSSPKFGPLVAAILAKDGTNGRDGSIVLRGFYSHFGHSYAGSSEDDAASGLIDELVGLEQATHAVPESARKGLILSIGATPTATAAQNMLSSSSPRVDEFHAVLARLKEQYTVELHAGVYPLLDCQQIATHARPSSSEARDGFQPLNKDSIAIRLLVEVTSIYPEREKPEALVSAGSLAMGREPCKSYPGWGIVTDSLGNAKTKSVYDERGEKTGWVVGKISQEHGILTWEGDKSKCNELAIGDKVEIWPNHACVAGAGFGWYLVVDSELGGDEIVDVWPRWRGW
ncbi:D-serine ammonia-lyase [Ascochyta lentis]